jgi:hypothetical protein
MLASFLGGAFVIERRFLQTRVASASPIGSLVPVGLLLVLLLETGLGLYAKSHPAPHPCSGFPACYEEQQLDTSGRIRLHQNYWPWNMQRLRPELLHRLLAVLLLLMSFLQLLLLRRETYPGLRLELGALVPILLLSLVLSGAFLGQSRWQALSGAFHFLNAGALLLVQGILTAGGLPSRAA